MQGKEINNVNAIRESRIIPAHAGKSRSRRFGTNRKKDHPCACREKSIAAPNFSNGVGSSLRMQGKGETAYTPATN